MPVERSKDHIARVGELSDPLEGSSAKGHQNGFRGGLACVQNCTTVGRLSWCKIAPQVTYVS